MNYEPILAVLPDNKEDAKSMKEIAQAMGLDTSSHQVRFENIGRLPGFSES